MASGSSAAVGHARSLWAASGTALGAASAAAASGEIAQATGIANGSSSARGVTPHAEVNVGTGGPPGLGPIRFVMVRSASAYAVAGAISKGDARSIASAAGTASGMASAVAEGASLAVGYRNFDQMEQRGRLNEESRSFHNDELRAFDEREWREAA